MHTGLCKAQPIRGRRVVVLNSFCNLLGEIIELDEEAGYEDSTGLMFSCEAV